MPTYDVHIYAIARVKVSRAEADSADKAAQQAVESVDLHQVIAGGQAEYAEQIEGVLVDQLDERGERREGRGVFLDLQRDLSSD